MLGNLSDNLVLNKVNEILGKSYFKIEITNTALGFSNRTFKIRLDNDQYILKGPLGISEAEFHLNIIQNLNLDHPYIHGIIVMNNGNYDVYVQLV